MMTSNVETIIQAVSPLFGSGAFAAGAAGAADEVVAAGAAVAVTAAAGAATAGLAASAGFASAAGAVAAGVAAGVCATAKWLAPNDKAAHSAPIKKRNFMFNNPRLKCIRAGFTGADTNDLFNFKYKNFAVTDFAGVGGFFDGFDYSFDELGFYRPKPLTSVTVMP
jgi:hypothetical protein